ncbi:MAG: hypothetical protein PHE49_02110 [bacterium]|nr:hypothetical protein [bacterium]
MYKNRIPILIAVLLVSVISCSKQSPFGPNEVKQLKSPLKVQIKEEKCVPIDGLDIAISGSYAYLSCWDELDIVNISDPLNPSIIKHFDIIGYMNNIAVSDSFVYITNNDSGSILIISVSNPFNPQQVGEYKFNIPVCFQDIAVVETHLYVTSDSGLYVIDVSNPASPSMVGEYDAGKVHPEFLISNGYLYLEKTLENTAELVIFDISTPSSLKKIGSYVINGGCIWGITLSFPYIYMSGLYFLDNSDEGNTKGGFWVIDVSTPSNPKKTGFCNLKDEYTDGLAVTGNYACIAADAAYKVIDISNLSHLLEIATCKLEYGTSVTIVGNYAYVLAYEGLYIIDTRIKL